LRQFLDVVEPALEADGQTIVNEIVVRGSDDSDVKLYRCYAFQGIDAPFVYDPSAVLEALYSHWTV